MLGVKRLYTFLLQTFVPVFFMTFFICLFIILMQFLWKYVDEMVGKGLEVTVLVELFFYAGLTFVPMALPLAVMLASLMTFGNLGERLELLAMKSSGVSLFQIMKPIIVVMIIVSGGAFYFQNVISPLAQLKLYSLLYSVRQKTPELDIPEGSFYDQLNGINIYVDKKDKETGILYDLMMYDFSEGFDNAMIIVSDSGRLRMNDDKKSIYLTLYHGESFSNVQQQRASNAGTPYRRESFTLKEFLIEFDANFNRMDEGRMQNTYIAKDMKALSETADSLTQQLDSINNFNARVVLTTGFLGQRTENLLSKNDTVAKDTPPKRAEKKQTSGFNLFSDIVSTDESQNNESENKTTDTTLAQENSNNRAETQESQTLSLIDIDSLYTRVKPDKLEAMYASAQNKVEQIKQDTEFKSASVDNKKFLINRHELEWHKKFTLSFACMIFFFIGAPLGAIIRKGGIGMPAVISVFLFICYFFIDNSGASMAKEQVISPMLGTWLSSIILLPLGIFLTYKAVNDSVIMNADTYLLFFKNLTVRPVRRIESDELSIHTITSEEMYSLTLQLHTLCNNYLQRKMHSWWSNYKLFWLGEDQTLNTLNSKMESEVIAILKNSTDKLLVLKLADFPILQLDRCSHPFTNERSAVKRFFCYFLPVGILFYLFSLWGQLILKKDLIKTRELSLEIMSMLKNQETPQPQQ